MPYSEAHIINVFQTIKHCFADERNTSVMILRVLQVRYVSGRFDRNLGEENPNKVGPFWQDTFDFVLIWT